MKKLVKVHIKKNDTIEAYGCETIKNPCTCYCVCGNPPDGPQDKYQQTVAFPYFDPNGGSYTNNSGK